MQTTIRNLPVPLAEVAWIAPAHPAGEERHGHRQAPPAPSDRSRLDGETAYARLPMRSAPLHPDKSQLPRPTSPDPGGESFDGRFGRHSFTRQALLTSASFQAQHLGQVPPYENEALLRAAASGAYRQASGLSVQYLGAFQPLDIRV